MAISDHDTTAGWPEAEAAAHRVGLPLLRGTEITATDENVSVHMLGYQYDPTNQHIADLFANTRAARLQRTQRMVELLSRDYPITCNPCSPKSRRVAKPPLAGLTSLMLW